MKKYCAYICKSIGNPVDGFEVDAFNGIAGYLGIDQTLDKNTSLFLNIEKIDKGKSVSFSKVFAHQRVDK